tara:strand:+ start:239 stop:1042 length:804 start_codon:yes stop_codon:yes gene_type:complete
MNSKLLLFFLAFGQLNATNVVLKKFDSPLIKGEFIGTYMEHVHLLIGDSVVFFNCAEIKDITVAETKKALIYDCSENTVSEEILFPPKIDPMTGEWITFLPDVFNTAELTQIKNNILIKKNKPKSLKSVEIKKKLENEEKGIKKPVYLTKKEIQVLIREELDKELFALRKAKTNKKKVKEPSIYERLRIGSISEKELNKIIDGRSPVELLEANLITQQEYEKMYKKYNNPITYMSKYGLLTTLNRKPEYLLLSGCAVYIFFAVFVFQ